MKKLLTILLAALLICGGIALPRMAAAEGKTPEEYGINTLGDVQDCESFGYVFYEDLFVLVIHKDGVFYRVEANIPAEVFDALIQLDLFDENYEADLKQMVRDLPVSKVVDLSEALLSKAELNALKGVTGEELTDMGFVPQGSYGFWDDSTLIYLVKGPFEYEVNFAEALEPLDNPNLVEIMAPLTVKDAAFANVSNYAMELAFDINGGPEYEYVATPSFPIPEIAVEDSPFATLADAFAVRGDTYISSMSDELYVLAFNTNGACYRVEAELAPDVVEEVYALDFADEDRDQKLDALLGVLPVSRVGDLSAVMPTQEELDALIGKTGQELLDLGFTYGMGYSFEDKAELYLVKDLFEYHVFFNETVPEMEDYDAVLDEILADLTVARAEIYGLADVCCEPELIW